MKHTVMVVEDDRTLAENIRSFLEKARWGVDVCETGEQALERLSLGAPRVVLSDYVLPGMSGTELLHRVTRLAPDTRFVMMTGSNDVQNAVGAMKAGAFDYLSKPVSLAEIKAILERAVAPALAADARTSGEAEGAGELDRIIGECPEMRQLKATVQQIIDAERRAPGVAVPAVLIHGETGTGKELIARAIHRDGIRRDGPFIEINCASIPAHLLESELFGHEKGAFTDARERKIGVVEAADGGTLFLDEIGELDTALQAKLLKLLEDRSIRRLGAVNERAVDVRIISATNRNLEQQVREGRFRSDLFFRLRIISLRVPPLRERGADLLKLARFYLARLGTTYGKPNLRLAADTERCILNYDWPGNVRELRNSLEQAVLLTHKDEISRDQLELCDPLAPPGNDTAPVRVLRIPKNNAELSSDEAEALVAALEQSGWNVTKAARRLGITRDMLRYRIDKLGLARPD